MPAGIVLVREAGGLVSDETNRQKMLENGNMVAGNEAIHAATFGKSGKITLFSGLFSLLYRIANQPNAHKAHKILSCS